MDGKQFYTYSSLIHEITIYWDSRKPLSSWTHQSLILSSSSWTSTLVKHPSFLPLVSDCLLNLITRWNHPLLFIKNTIHQTIQTLNLIIDPQLQLSPLHLIPVIRTPPPLPSNLNSLISSLKNNARQFSSLWSYFNSIHSLTQIHIILQSTYHSSTLFNEFIISPSFKPTSTSQSIIIIISISTSFYLRLSTHRWSHPFLSSSS